MEDLTRTQTVLLCVLVSFVTSIGTGIITASLLQEAPPGVTQTINQVVERTVERVVPGPAGSQTVKETTVVVKEEDLVIDAIKKNEKSLVRIAQNPPRGSANTSLNTIALGLVVSSDGKILADRRAITAAGGSNFVATFFDGKQFPIKTISAAAGGSGSALGDAVYLEFAADAKDPSYVIYPAVTTDSNNLQLGQTVIALGGKNQNQVAIGRISLLTFAAGNVSNSRTSTTDGAAPAPASTPASGQTVSLIQTESSLKDELPGALLLNLNGDIVGIEAWHPEAPSLPDQFSSINLVKAAGAKFFQ